MAKNDKTGFKKAFWLFVFVGLLAYGMAYPKSEIFGRITYNLKTHDKTVALTFDDGPNGIYTQQVLDILDQNKVKATFFLIGENVQRYPTLAREIAQKGHQIGNHSFDHIWLLPFKSPTRIISEVNKTEAIITAITGAKPNLFRPPHGWRSPWMIKAVSQEGYKVVNWDDSAQDYLPMVSSGTIARRIIGRVRPGSIIDLHDGFNLDHGANRQNMVGALDIIIKSLKNEGYRFVLAEDI